MPVTLYTTYDEIRAVLGLDSEELTDTELSLEMFENGLSLAISDIKLPESYTDSLDVVFEALPDTNRTVEQQRLYDLTRLFATYQVAYDVAVSLPGRMMKSISDGKSVRTRFSPESVYQSIVKRIQEKLAMAKVALQNIGSATVTGFDYFYAVPPGVDRVTNS